MPKYQIIASRRIEARDSEEAKKIFIEKIKIGEYFLKYKIIKNEKEKKTKS